MSIFWFAANTALFSLSSSKLIILYSSDDILFSAQNSMDFVYSPLDRSAKEIRLIKLTNLDAILELNNVILDNPELAQNPELRRSIEDDVPIRCIMYHVSHKQDLTYPALSYMWGDGKRNRRMIVEVGDKEADLMITDGLSDALRNIQVEGLWWIDAVCINQSDNEEKSWQVQMMREIYEKATRVAAWIGPAADNSALLIDQLMDLPERRLREHLTRHEYWTPPEDSIDLRAFWALIKRPYWRRVWVQQELQNNKPDVVMIYCGKKRILASLVSFALQGLRKKLLLLGAQGLGAIRRDSYASLLSAFLNDPDVEQCISLFNGHVHAMKRDIKPSLSTLLAIQYVNNSQLKASDPRDLIYALLGMCTDSHKYWIKPDYSKTKAQVYTETSVVLLKLLGMSVLRTTNFGYSANPDPSLPSWVADWSQPFPLPLSSRKGHSLNETYPPLDYAASRGLRPQKARLGKKINGTLLSLQLSGIRVDVVAHVGEPMSKISRTHMNELISDQDINFNLQIVWLEQIEALSKHCGSAYGGDEGTLEAVWRVPITNAEIKQRAFYKASASMRDGYQIYRSGYLRAAIPAHEFYSDQSHAKLKLGGAYWQALAYRSGGRKFFVTDGGLLGVGPAATQQGDIVAVVAPHECPIVLRPKGEACYQWLGESYVHGIMDGEVGECADESTLEEFTII
ncbi:uncharacterized protein PV09_07617 [Verruconis gallopava]|uniref:Heterokaryon incompatibility domain-containing protein n=1 Tax=Verruconis gallopava TaxID=253628 RepID=A0A0D2A390_9PEZI|nr:uncharacterized protein PV09_07617 [Verruconis gallopava]KIW00860.1 hypothetical protein PV09_07617 [Verruconis gallopava]